jgi:quercetin dioxygenase-like cupin family protein
MSPLYHYITDMMQELPAIPADSIVSHTLHNDAQARVVLFGFAAGQELSEHTASQPAILHFLQGEARLTLADDVQEARAGTWVHMPPRLRHSVHAITPGGMLLVLLKTAVTEPVASTA